MKMCNCEATRFKFNLNSHICFKPTELGKIIYKAYWMPYSKDGKGSELEIDDEGWSEMQLWDFIRIFGQSFTCGMNCPVETTVILIDDVTEQMKCPFELPVKFSAYIPVGDSPVDNGYIEDAKGNPIIIPILREQVDYIVQAINSHEKLAEKYYKDYKRLWELADKDNCDGDCDLEPPHNRCAECLARSALNDLGEMRGQLMDEIEQALEEAEKQK